MPGSINEIVDFFSFLASEAIKRRAERQQPVTVNF